MTAPNGTKRPLEGLRVVDLTVINGELCPRLLADLGAEVVKVEPPDGSPARALAPVRKGVSLSWAVNNAGKLGVALDLTDPDDFRRFHELLDHADVLVTSDPVIVGDITVQRVTEAHPHLVVAALTPYGLTGPWSGRVITDSVLSATGGMTFKAGVLDREPIPAPSLPTAAPQSDVLLADDLSRIKGLGPKLQKLLPTLGLSTFAQIAALTEADLAELDTKLGAFAGRPAKDNWVEQAKYLAAGDTAGFEARFGKV